MNAYLAGTKTPDTALADMKSRLQPVFGELSFARAGRRVALAQRAATPLRRAARSTRVDGSSGSDGERWRRFR
ncbi:MAG: hypothetical protein MZV49_09025 [Rhodopseudomonas palustris]|nr:hypothetical protein [Rhodopseudomonas palustris]